MTGADVGEAEQLGCGQVLREGISPDRQLRQKCLLWGRGGSWGERGWVVAREATDGCAGLLHPAFTGYKQLSPGQGGGQTHIKSISQMTPEVARGRGN